MSITVPDHRTADQKPTVKKEPWVSAFCRIYKDDLIGLGAIVYTFAMIGCFLCLVEAIRLQNLNLSASWVVMGGAALFSLNIGLFLLAWLVGAAINISRRVAAGRRELP